MNINTLELPDPDWGPGGQPDPPESMQVVAPAITQNESFIGPFFIKQSGVRFSERDMETGFAHGVRAILNYNYPNSGPEYDSEIYAGYLVATKGVINAGQLYPQLTGSQWEVHSSSSGPGSVKQIEKLSQIEAQ